MDPSLPSAFDPTDLAIMANRMEGIVREMENTVLRTARSSVVGLSKDFSCSIVSSDDELLFSAEGLPVHVFGSGLLSRAMRRIHPDFRQLFANTALGRKGLTPYTSSAGIVSGPPSEAAQNGR